jgi:hypothetical protein
MKEDLIKIVDTINDSIYEQSGLLVEKFGIVCTLESNGYQHIIKFLDCCIWDSDNDERKYDYEEEVYVESIESYVRAIINDVIGELKDMKL